MIGITQAAFLASAIAAGVPSVVYRDLGPAPVNASISVAMTLRYHRNAELSELVRLQADPHSPYYHHWLRSDQFDAAFAPSPAEYGRVIASLQRAGFRVTQTFANRTVIDAVGNVATVDRYFGTKIDRVAQAGRGLRFANVTPAHVPPDLHGLLFAVNGLHDLELIESNASPARGTLAARRRSTVTGAPLLFGPTNAANGQDGYGPLAFLRGYDFMSSHDKSDDGSGRASAIVTDGNFAENDLAKFLAYFRIKRTGPATVRIGSNGRAVKDIPPDPTTTLEVEGLVALAPGTALYLYESGSANASSAQGITDAFNRVISDNKADVVDAPFGQCESTDVTATTTWDHLAEQGSALGITFEAPLINGVTTACNGWAAPATSPNFTAVGGTELVVNDLGKYETEFAALAGIYHTYYGGASSVFALPSWQQNIKNIIPTGRNTPDIAFDAAYFSAMAEYYGGTWQNQDNPSYGTQLASSIFDAALVQIEQSEGKRLGLVAPTLYALWEANGYQHGRTTYFHDIIEQAPAEIGYDQVTGIGSFDVWNIAQLLGR